MYNMITICSIYYVYIGDHCLQNMYSIQLYKLYTYYEYGRDRKSLIQYDTTAVGQLPGVFARSLELLVHPP